MRKFVLNCGGRLLPVERPLVMGILNVTGDSFYAGSRVNEIADAVLRAGEMLEAGADLLDLGGQSSRPGAERLSAEDEAARVVPAIAAIHERFPEAFISVDTFYSGVARQAIGAGAALVNDISAGRFDPQLLPTVAGLQVPYVLMHMQGRPESMQNDPHYENITDEVLEFLAMAKEKCRQAGIRDVVVDPGFGFGKTIGHNFELLRNLKTLQILNSPVLIGISRKSTIYKTLGVSPEDALNGSTVLHTIGLLQGANILRVHDVKEAFETVRLVERYRQ